MRTLKSAFAAGLAVLATAIAAHAAGPATATAAVKLAGGADGGTVTFTESTAGVLLKFDLKGLKPGFHAAAIHEKGSCEGNFASAGAVYNPLGAEHGLLNDNGPMAGDLPNINADATGVVAAELLTPLISLGRDTDDALLDADGAAIVIYDQPGDHITSPEAAGMTRIACGTITSK